MPLFRPIQQISSSNVGLWMINESVHDLKDSIAEKSFDLSQLEQIHVLQKQKQWLASRTLIRAMNDSINLIQYDVHGAPHTDTGMKISLSHSHELVCVMLNEREEVGIDIQHKTEKIKRIRHKFCHKYELEYSVLNEEIQRLHLIWCAKEALYKKLKTPGLIFKDELFIEPFDLAVKGKLNARIKRKELPSELELGFEIIEDYTLVYTLNS